MPEKWYTAEELKFFMRNGIMVGSLTGPRAVTKFERPVWGDNRLGNIPNKKVRK
jgi:hypothetical protein